MTPAAILVPFVFLATGFTVVMILLYRNLQRLDQEVAASWRHVQELRRARLDAAARLLDSAAANGCGDVRSCGFEEKIAASRAAEGPEEAAAADTALAQAWRRLSAEADLRSLASTPAAHAALDDLQDADDRLAAAERLHNNRTTIYNNAGVTFPALLVAKRAGFSPRQLYRPLHVTGKAVASRLDDESLAEKSPRIMNAYMLWAVGMSDTTMEEQEERA